MSKALRNGAIASGVTGAGLYGATASLAAPAANLGGYALAQTLVGGGVPTTMAILVCGGPLVVGVGIALGVGGLVVGLTKLFR